MLKRFFAILLCFCMIFAFASCDLIEKFTNTDSTEDDDIDDIISGITKEEWNNAIAEEKFDNVTYSILVTFKGETEVYPIMCKLDGEKATFKEDSYDEQIVDGETAAAIRNIYMSTTLAILEKFDNFTYNAESAEFVSTADIVYDVTVIEYTAKITASNVKVKIDANKNIAEISCSMKQEYSDGGSDSGVLELDVTFTFTNYGTTVVGSSGGNNGGNNGGNSQTTDLSTAYQNSCSYKNVTVSVHAVETLPDGTENIDDEVYKTTATAYTPRNNNIFTIENGSTYLYNLTESGWNKNNVSSNAPIGTLVEMYVGMFESVFDSFTYDAETGKYSAQNVTVNMYGSDMVYDFVSIQVKDGLVCELEFIMPTGEGTGHATLSYYDYGKTVIELPESYNDLTGAKE